MRRWALNQDFRAPVYPWWRAAVLILILWVMSSPSPAEETLLGHPIHTAPFGTRATTGALKWVDDSHLALNETDRVIVWNVDTGQTVEEVGRHLICVDTNGSEPIFLMKGVERVPPQGDPPEGDPKRDLLFPKYLGPWGQETRLGPDQERTTDLPTRDLHQPSGQTFRQWFVRESFTGCLGRWLPDESTPPHMIEPIHKHYPLFAGKIVVDWRGGRKDEPLRLHLADRPESVELDILRRDISAGWSGLGYYAFKRAYLALGYGNELRKPWRYWWLHEDGAVEAGGMPPLMEASSLVQNEAPGRKFSHQVVGLTAAIPTKLGFIVTITFSLRDGPPLDILVLEDGTRWRLLYKAAYIQGPLLTSPNGCRIAFAATNDRQRRTFNGPPMPIKVVDLCDATTNAQ
ncbi:hypothetical protein MTBLM5_190011 [Magnetospirillum sp. LM-5]|uniref:hypothetical protein n=1 Tax=Magnetospirillum sp. LM-5 TaxID=2681466 RepID=UPI001382579D|nr:hypothetical protein [Magnetospirillum sp. LM-5]CAA7616082.1 hypothetical protein MTBLM5_190011 [Magnetospirillum sp. LM-5]